MLVKISDIAVINRQRKEMDVDKLKELAASIEQNGLLHPPVIRYPFDGEQTNGKPFVLCVGGRRIGAHILLQRTEIEVKLKEDLDPISAEIVELDENIKRQNITWQEETDARTRIAELRRQQLPGITQTELAAEIGVSVAQLSKDLQLADHLKADPSLRQANSKGSALRVASHKATIKTREANIQTTDATSLRGKLFTADGRDFIRTLPSQSIDLVFSDLPYGIDYFDVNAGASNITKGYYDDSANSAKDFIADIVPECLRVVKPTGWVVFFMCYEWHVWLQDLIHSTCIVHGQYKADRYSRPSCTAVAGTEREAECSFPFQPELPPWIWTRRGKGNHGHWPELHASNRYELLVVANGGKAVLTKKPVENVLDFLPFDGERLHAMQKPMPLCQEIIARTTVIGERMLDVCMGSGAHLAAAASLGRDFLGCDKNPENLSGAMQLVSQHYNQASADAIARGKANGTI